MTQSKRRKTKQPTTPEQKAKQRQWEKNYRSKPSSKLKAQVRTHKLGLIHERKSKMSQSDINYMVELILQATKQRIEIKQDNIEQAIYLRQKLYATRRKQGAKRLELKHMMESVEIRLVDKHMKPINFRDPKYKEKKLDNETFVPCYIVMEVIDSQLNNKLKDVFESLGQTTLPSEELEKKQEKKLESLVTPYDKLEEQSRNAMAQLGFKRDD